ncbi:hybrid sensor and regulator [Duganella sp. Leaf126]|nr:hybrid sensor and regulator [Duganella sp. Leaf126]
MQWGAGWALAASVGVGAYALGARIVDADARQRFDHMARSTQYALAARAKAHADLTRSLAALAGASDGLDDRRLRQYVDGLDLPRHLPAVVAIRWEPVAGDPVVIDLAAQSANAAGSGSVGAGVVGMRLPAYRPGLPTGDADRRQAALLGTAALNFSVAKLVQVVLDEIMVRGLELDLYADASTAADRRRLVIEPHDRLQYSDHGAHAPSAPDGGQFVAVLPVDFNGALWKARFQVRKDALRNGFDVVFPLAAGLAGGAGTLLLYSYLAVLYSSRRRAVKQRVLLDTVLSNLDAHVYMKDQQRRYLYVNPKMAEYLGLPAAQVVGRTDRELMSEQKADAAWALERPVFDDGVKRAGQTCFACAAGVPQYHWNVLVPVTLGRAVTAVIGVSTDVTELHQLKERADSANRAKSDFLSNMSHEIRTPMNSIIGMAHLALKTVTHPKQRDYLQKIHHSGQHLLGIINDILDFSKIEAGKMDLEVLDFSIDRLLNNLTAQLGDAAAARGLALVIDIAPDLPRQLRGDPLRLEQVLINFTSNAIKFSEQGRVQVRARLVEQRDHQLLVRFDVQDNGIGMSEAGVAQLFQSFHQADTSTTRRYGGTGLGLVISQQLAELMGGQVGVESRLGAGSTFWFTARLALPQSEGQLAQMAHNLPLRPEGADGRHQDAEASAIDPLQAGLFESIRGASILLVEDNIFSQQVGKELLEDGGATVCVANNGKEAIDLLLKERFDCVLMDVQMPVMDGFEATRLIRAHPALSGTLVIAMTANAGREDQQRCLDAGMDEFVTKPVAPRLLFAVLARWLVQRAPPAQPALPPLAAPSVPATPDAANITVPAAAPAPAAAAATSADGELFDLDALAQTFAGKCDKMRKYTRLFLESASEGMVEIDAALAAGDVVLLSELGHRLKSSARAVGATRFGNLCLALEQGRRHPDTAAAAAIVAQMHALLPVLGPHMEQELLAYDPG